MRRRPPRSTRADTAFPTRRSSDLLMTDLHAGDWSAAQRGNGCRVFQAAFQRLHIGWSLPHLGQGARSASRTRRRIARRLDARSAPGQPAMRAIFIRHGQSTGNAGVPCDDLGAIELTELGQEQAREVAASWTQAPALIVTSPYTRTRQQDAQTSARLD